MPRSRTAMLRLSCLFAATIFSATLHAAPIDWTNSNAGSWNVNSVGWRVTGNVFTSWTNSSTAAANFGSFGTPTTVHVDGISLSGSGPITVNSINFNTTGYTIAPGRGTFTLAGNTPTINVTNAGDSATITAAILGANGLITAGNGTLILGGQSTYAGGTTVASGTLRTAIDNALPNTALSVSSAGTLDLTGFNQALSNLDINGTVKIAAASDSSSNPVPSTGQLNLEGLSGSGSLFLNHAGILDLNISASISTFSGNINPTGTDTSGSFVKDGSGMLILTGTARITGAFSAPAFSVIAGTLAGNTANLRSTIDVADGAFVLFNQNTDDTFTGTIRGEGNVQVNGTAVLTLSQPNTYTGATTVHSGGTLAVSNDNQLGTLTVITPGLGINGLPTLTIKTDNAFLNFDGGALRTTAPITSARSIQITANGGTIDTFGNASTFSGPITALITGDDNGTGPLTVTGGGTATFSTAVSNFGSILINNAAVTLDNTNIQLALCANTPDTVSLGVGPGSLIMQNGAALITFGGGFIGSPTGGSVTIDGVDSRWTEINAINLGIARGSGTLILQNGAAAFASTLTAGRGAANSASLTITSGSSFTVGNASLGSFNGHAAASISGAGSTFNISENLDLGDNVVQPLLVTASGNLTVTTLAAVTVTGTTTLHSNSSLTVIAGTFSTGALASTGNIAALHITDADTPALVIGSDSTPDGIFLGNISNATSGPGSVRKIGANTQTLAGDNTYTGSTAVEAGTLVLSGNSASSDFSANNTATLNFAGNAVNLAFNSITANAGGTVTYTDNVKITGGFLFGPGRHNFANASLTGTQIFNGAQLNITNAAFKSVTNSGAIAVSGAAANLTWNGGTNIGSLDAELTATVNLSNFTSSGIITVGSLATINVSNADLILSGGSRTTVNGVPGPGGGILFAGNLKLTGASSIQLNGGLLTNNGIITGPTHVNFGGVTKGSGTYGELFLTDGGKFSPGNSPGNVTTADTTWGAAGDYEWQLTDAAAAPGTGFDHWTINGNLIITAGTTTNSRFVIDIETINAANNAAPADNFNPALPYSWEILSTTNTINGFDPSYFTLDTTGFKNPTNGGSFSLTQTPTALQIHFTPAAVPEPATLSLAAVGLLLLTTRRRACR